MNTLGRFPMVGAAALLVCAAAASAAPSSTGAYPRPAVAAAVVMGDHYPARRTPFPGGVTGFADVKYAELPGFRPLTLDVYVPPGARSKAVPLVLYIHGGGWEFGHSRQSGAFENWPRVLAMVAARGYTVASLNYRLSGEAPFPAAIQDVKTAILWLHAHARDYGIDKSRTIVWGGSAGGHLAALAAVSCGVKALEPDLAQLADGARLAKESDCVQGAVTWYGVFDFANFNWDAPGAPAQPHPVPEPIARFLACAPRGCAPATVRAASPISYVKASTPPFLIMYGSVDKTVPPKQSISFAAAMKAAGAHAELIEIPGVAHSFIGSTPQATKRGSLEAFDRTLDFIDSTVGHAHR